MSNSPADVVAAAVERLQAASAQREALAPLRRAISDVDEEARTAALAASAAGLSERAIAAQLGVTQPTVHSWLDERRSAPVPARTVAAQAWTLHHLATALASQVARLRGHELPGQAPGSQHVAPSSAASTAYKGAVDVAGTLANLAAALDYAVRTKHLRGER
ncbi:helix-turn-helix domain-containing protein [Micromonospora sp. WMMD737]|uniref:helix-turn-helix domain-containing protein n=1 Tax=Micromonospora sp. WMMD737 TaxID=3404113 RepID=UPI003B92A6FE